MSTVLNEVTNNQKSRADEGQVYTFGRNTFLVEGRATRNDITLGTVLANLMKSEFDEALPVRSRSTK